MSADNEEQQIREIVLTWISATAEGDLDRVLGLMAEDVVFLSAGQPPLRGRDAFESVSRSMAGKMRFEGHPDIREIHVAGDYAFCWTRLHVTATPRDEGLPIRRAGDVFSVFRKEQDGRWRLFRDANMLARV
jgi:uncharacterized protein (TIGR02246 family)